MKPQDHSFYRGTLRQTKTHGANVCFSACCCSWSAAMEHSTHLAYEELKLLSMLLETEQLSLAAQRLSVSVSTVSRQLGRAREIVGDQLFVRSKAGLVPTSRMIAMAPRIAALLEAWEALLEAETAFSPAHLKRSFHLMSADNGLNAYVNAAIQPIHSAAPLVRLIVEPLVPEFWRTLRSGAVDAVIFPTETVPAECRSVPLPVMRPILLMRCGHPLLSLYRQKGDLSAEDIERYPIAHVDPRVGVLFEELVDAAWNKASLVLPYYNAVKPILQSTDYVSWVPEASARDWIASGALAGVRSSAASFPPFVPRLIWHERTHADPACQWLRGMILRYAPTGASPSNEVYRCEIER